MAILHKLRWSSVFEERYCYIASDGYAYERPRGDRVRRYAHDGGTQTDDATRERLTRAEVGEDLWKEILRAFLRNCE